MARASDWNLEVVALGNPALRALHSFEMKAKSWQENWGCGEQIGLPIPPDVLVRANRVIR